MENDLLYKALMLGRNKKSAREEYLISTGKKTPAFAESCSKEICFADIFKDTASSIKVRLVNDGYLEIFASADAEFLRFDQSAFTSDEARDGYVEIPFMILAENLHNGKNFGEIILRTAYQKISVPVIVDNRIAVKVSDMSSELLPLKITAGYLEFRKGFISQEHWQEETLNNLSKISGNSPADLFFMLYKAHVYAISGDDTDTENLLEYVTGQLSSRNDYSPELYAYSLYVRSLYEKNESLTQAALKIVKEKYEQAPSWQLLWLIFYMDETCFDNPEYKFGSVQKLFKTGKCISPVMYYEAYEALKNTPELLNGQNIDFGLQLLNFAVKNKIAETAPALALSDLLYEAGKEELSKINLNLAVRILKDAFDKYPVSSLSNTIAKLLVYLDNRQKENHIFFERAVFDFADIPLLYNYYIFTMNEDEMPRIPERILTYFSKDSSYLFESRQYFFANMITNRYENFAYRTAYEACEGQIISFAYDCCQKGKNSKLLGIIYGHVLQNSGEDIDLKRALFKISFLKEISCENSFMARVMVFHEELRSYEEVSLIKGRALVNIYSPGALILFKDETGNIFKSVDYTVNSFEDETEYAGFCMNAIPVCAVMIMGKILEITIKQKPPAEILSFLLLQFKKDDFNREYLQKLLCRLLRDLKKTKEAQKVYDRLIEFISEDIGPEARGLLTELMIETKHYDEAADEIKQNGYDYINPESLRTLTHVLVQIKSEEEKDFLLMLSEYCLVRGVYDSEILRYMCRNYDGDLRILLLLYEKSASLKTDNLQVAERIIIKSADCDEQPEDLQEIFLRCYKESENRDLINYFLELQANKYLYNPQSCATYFFEYFSLEVLKGIRYSHSAQTAWLLFMKDEKEISPKLLKALKDSLTGLVYQGIMLEEFKAYKDRFDLPPVLLNTYIAKYISADGETPEIKYKITSSQRTIQKAVYMDRLFDGIYVKYFTLLFGDDLTYSIEAGKGITVNFSQIRPLEDGSRYYAANEVSRLEYSGNSQAFNAALKRYYIKDELIRRLF